MLLSEFKTRLRFNSGFAMTFVYGFLLTVLYEDTFRSFNDEYTCNTVAKVELFATGEMITLHFMFTYRTYATGGIITLHCMYG